MKKSLKQQMHERSYAVQVTVYVHAFSAEDAQSYLETALKDWAAKGRMIPAMRMGEATQSDLLFLGREES
jgi:hypothetical protein